MTALPIGKMRFFGPDVTFSYVTSLQVEQHAIIKPEVDVFSVHEVTPGRISCDYRTGSACVAGMTSLPVE